MAILLCAFVFTACSDDEPSAKELTNEEMVSHINSVLNNNLDKMYVNETLDQFLLPVDNDAAARALVQEIILEKWNGQDYTFHVPVNYGQIRIMPSSDEGVFYTLVFNLANRKPYTIHLCTEEYLKSENVAMSTNAIIHAIKFI